ncbi:uncharacterized protein BYT42DRAFT_566959 [Radiomyces spectabilis]|uniref:uncharacterized protein n=1 Tax=Radiomyces spectabilis TaxID=64574 RepID=UPI00221FC311|nr:uncharacterized protein BYT42DRAFT_566959 [Radiomyces spectabilis]KAI8381561.1 hypothetical protein BYT42DRAFT_566959 [Radiomyces spectabilis]
MINRPNNVIYHQRVFQGQPHTPLWLKGPRDRFFATIVFAGIGVGLTGAFYGAFKMIRGEK